MSDSFADLWASSAPKPPQTLGSSAAKQTTSPTLSGSAKKYDAFSMLSNASSPSISATNSRSGTPNVGVQRPAAQQLKPSSSGDAFAGLGFSSKSEDGKNMTIAERAKKAEQDRLNAQLKLGTASQAKPQADHGQWAGLDALGAPASKPAPSQPASVDDDWGLGSVSAPKKEPKVEDDWGLGDFGTSSTPAPMTKTPTTTDKPKMALWDLDDFESLSSQPTPAVSNASRPNDSPDDDFDFGNREDGPQDDGDDILGVLTKPVSASARTTPSPIPSPQPATQRPKPTSRSTSPPPHVIGAIVEMGFTPQQARVALAATDTGVDVEAALEVLLSQTESSQPSRPTREQESQDDGWGRPPPPRRTEQSARSRPERTGSARSQNTDQVQTQADKLISQASELGMNVFNKANTFWNIGKQKVQKAYEEYNAGEGSRTKSDGRPRWMQESGEREPGPRRPAPRQDDGWGDVPSGSGFKDDDDEPAPVPQKAPPSRAPKPKPKPEPEVDLFSSAPSAPSSSNGGVYVPKSRRMNAREALSSSPAHAAAAPSKPKRPEITATAAELATSSSHSARGTQSLAAGSYGDAESAFSRAIDSLPAKHLALVPLYNDRALARLKNGDANGAIADTGNVINILGDVDSYGTAFDRAQLVTAWKRRAEAFEAREKWDDARQDWERVAGCSWANDKEKGEGVRGAGRCRTALAPKPAKPKPVVRPPVRSGPTPPSKAVVELRKANEAAEAEAELRHALKDSVDARLMAWKGGKENNIRALLASLDSVLWAELKWETVGMKDLITDKQVKIKYMKAIGRVHPDKLNASNTTLEHRMIANGVFGTLNEAWNAFQSS